MAKKKPPIAKLDQETTKQLGKSLIVGETLAAKLRGQFLRATILGNRYFEPIWSILDRLRSASEAVTPLIAESLWGSDLAAWLSAYQWNYNRLPKWLQTHISESGPPPVFDRTGFDLPRRIWFPKIENAAKGLMKRKVLTRPDFDLLSDRMKSRAFTMAEQQSEDAIGAVRDILSEMTRQGPKLADFDAKVNEAIGGSPLGPAHVENVYRTNLQAAYRDGRESLVANPVVTSVFPYQEYIAIHDDRTRPDHLAMEDLGLNGTNVYRRDDPIWDYYTPPWHYNCRCGVNLLTLEAAARKGVKEAQKWLDTGLPPVNPEFRIDAIPHDPNPGFGQRHGVLI